MVAALFGAWASARPASKAGAARPATESRWRRLGARGIEIL
jgi:hypothetical protein